ncbi:MAG: NirD/YgiW/YdeI family stress tolerance protein [Mailhella sp.]|nr:NirD/YgiW/YdeI family stress tolerance protein [Mailhella sp.]
MRYVLPAFLSLVLAVPAYAAFEGPGAAPTVKDAASVPQAAKDSPVLLEGVIVSKNGDELYMFEDASGTVLLEIDDDVMVNKDVSSEDKVRLSGRVDSEDGKPTVDVDMLEVLE